MYNEHQIIIEAVANGFVVIFPEPLRQYMPADIDALVMAGKKIRGDGDDILEKIRNENSENDESEKPLKISKAMNAHVFKTFSEVLSFLDYKMKE